MRNIRTNAASLIVFCVILACLLALPAWPQTDAREPQAPAVRKIEPPNWWVNYTPDLTLLLTGENLSGARVESPVKGLTTLGAEASSNGHYLFVHLQLSPDLPPGIVPLRLITSAGSTTVQLPFLARADSRGHFEGFSRDDVIYLIMPDRFADGDPSNDRPANDRPPGSTGVYDRSQPRAYHGGDLRGIRDHLGYLHDLGVTTLWLTPVWKNTDSDYHGYHVVDFYALDDHMGSMQEYQALVADAHRLGMKVLIDYVVNHTGPNHPWANDPPTPTWFHGTPEHHLEPAYTFNGLVDPHASPREYLNTLNGWFANKLPDLNPDDPKLGLYLAQNAMWWVETAQLDGFRLDTFPYSTRRFWSEWHERLRQVYPQTVYPQVMDVGEVWDGDSTITSFFEGGRKQFDGIDSGLATVFDFPLCFALRDAVVKGASMGKIVDVLRHDQLYPHPETLVTFIGNHDNARFLGEKSSNPAKLKAAFSLLLTLRGIPQIYYGDEIAMTGGGDPDNRRDFPGGFPGDPRNAFTAAGRTAEQQDIFAHVQALLALRKSHPALRTGKQWHIGWDDNYYAFLRDSPQDGDKLLVVYNNSTKKLELNIPVDNTPLETARQLQSVFGDTSAELVSGKVRVSLPAQTLAVFSVH
ncbi:MAG TPA: alpha-amylase family glycosyl hydrolase [Terriglobales bacterium]|jgi:glycosidase|nr:alpha-amylase family glycosyl hydrolase [Terriglobales bacterium]